MLNYLFIFVKILMRLARENLWESGSTSIFFFFHLLCSFKIEKLLNDNFRLSI